jgi:hypothetical protein
MSSIVDITNDDDYKYRVLPRRMENARTILLYKDSERDNQRNWRPITVTSVIYRALFCRISKSLYEAHELQGIRLFDMEQ